MRKRKALTQTATAQDLQRVDWRKMGLRAGLSLLASIGFLWLLSQRLAHIDPAELFSGFETLGLASWTTALGLTLLSFVAVGQYDAVMHRHFNSGISAAAARRAGICAIAVSQTLGFGLITGSILRWRMLPGQSLWNASRLTAAVALSFLLGWAFVTALALCILPAAPFRTAAAFALAAMSLVALLSLLAQQHQRLPNGFTLSRLVGLTAIDTLAAAAALWVLCPPMMALPFLTLLPAFLLAFGAGLISGAPGGVGPFEMTLLALLPEQPEPALLSAILAWRGCYYALPALLASAIAMRGARVEPATPAVPTGPLMQQPRSAELGLFWQGEHRLSAASCDSGLLLGRTHHGLVGLFDPIARPSLDGLTKSLNHLTAQAKSVSCIPTLYKTSARPAAVARQLGHSCLRIAAEAVLFPASYRLDCPQRAGLRRKLRHAKAAGISVTRPNPIRDWAALETIAQTWAQAHGGERGFSMGRFCPHYLSQQRIYVAWQNQLPIAFVSFHLGANDWALDLIRYGPELPDGTIHLLIQTAIDEAKALDLSQLSLAAVPDFSALPVLLRRYLARLSSQARGLTRFKSAFAPDWQPRYLTAPGSAALVLVAAEIASAIHRPAPLDPRKSAANEQGLADIEFASDRHTWHRRGNRV
jgi:phosphatidylglycerol lysyltransferase